MPEAEGLALLALVAIKSARSSHGCESKKPEGGFEIAGQMGEGVLHVVLEGMTAISLEASCTETWIKLPTFNV